MIDKNSAFFVKRSLISYITFYRHKIYQVVYIYTSINYVIVKLQKMVLNITNKMFKIWQITMTSVLVNLAN